ncbi:hypothetical protein LCGC14_2077820 [marine sediment metagenome]|uniref:DUF1877 domain-containing protein n=1 Tax=marine sediment metagenome TaxID=412755 RepID=A0A0F9EGP4_9ZZZZ
MCELLMRLSKDQLDQIFMDHDFFWILRNRWRDTDHCIDIDKAWHGIHYLFNQSTKGGIPPLKWVVFGDKEGPDLDGGYGPAHYLTPFQVSEVNDQIKNITLEELKKRYDPEEFWAENIYPPCWDESEWDYLLFHYRQLKNFYQKAADEGEYVLMVIG